MESGDEPDVKATRLSNSVALRLDCELASEFRLALDVVMDGSVAGARSILGLLLLLLRVDESLRDIGRESGDMEDISAGYLLGMWSNGRQCLCW